jgi:hypothetical protein
VATRPKLAAITTVYRQYSHAQYIVDRSLELPFNCQIEHALMIGNRGSDAMDNHALEAIQCMQERRRGDKTASTEKIAILQELNHVLRLS